MEKMLDYIPKIVIRDSAVDAICHGADLAVPGILKLETEIKHHDLIAILTMKEEIVALGRSFMSTEEMLNRDRGIAVDTKRVIMSRGTYPSAWKQSHS